MKFTCERCSAQYMISDEKVGPAGVKVRCKKCGNVIHVRRTEAGAADAAAPAAANGAPGAGLDAELGQAFDSAFGDGGAVPHLDATQAMSAEDAAKIATAPEPPPGEWYVAIGQAQVGPLPIGEIRKKWEAGDVGPDSLVWKPGMGDWSPLSTVQDLSAYLAPIARAPARPSRPAMEAVRDSVPRYGTATGMPAAQSPAAQSPGAGTPARGTQAAPAPGKDANWKPAGASALAALASDEIAARNAPEPARPAAAAKPAGGSLVDAMNLPDGGVDPTGAIPLAIKGMEKTEERKVSSIAATAAKQRRSRGVLVAVLVTLVLVVGGAAAAVFLGLVEIPGFGGASAPEVAQAPTAPAAPPAAPAPEPVAAAPAATPAAPPAEAAPAQAAPTPAPEPVKAEPPKPAVAAAPPPEPKKAATRTTTTTRTAKKEPERVAAAPAPAAAPASKKASGGVLDFEDNDAALNEALGGSKSTTGRSVYVPPAAGAATASSLPKEVSTGQIQEAVAGRVDALRRCVQEQKAREPDVSGSLKMAWTIMGDGTPANVRCVTPEYASGQFAACLGGVIRNIRFPKSQTTGQPVTFPFSF